MRYVACLASLIICICGPVRADWDSAMIARQRGDLEAAYAAFEQEARAGAVDAQAVVGEMLIKGQGVPKDEAAGLAWFRRAADGGSVVAMLVYGSAAFAMDKARGVRWITQAADAGSPAAMLLLGDCYEHGTGVPRNVLAAHDWFLKAAQGGDADGMVRLSDLLLSPSEGANDERAGMEWLIRAAEAGQTSAQTRLAEVWYRGSYGLNRNESEALRWAQKAAFKDNHAAGLLCALYGRGLNPDLALAFRWCGVAAQYGQPEAMVALAGLYQEGTMRDPAASLMWASIAAGQSTGTVRQDAVRLRDLASGAMSEPERIAAQTRAAGWRPAIRSVDREPSSLPADCRAGCGYSGP